MTEPRRKRFAARPLLVAGAGVTVIVMGATQSFASGNLMAPDDRDRPKVKCPPGMTPNEDETACFKAKVSEPDAGTATQKAPAKKPAR